MIISVEFKLNTKKSICNIFLSTNISFVIYSSLTLDHVRFGNGIPVAMHLMDTFLFLTPHTVDGMDSISRGFVTIFKTVLAVAAPVSRDEATQTYCP